MLRTCFTLAVLMVGAARAGWAQEKTDSTSQSSPQKVDLAKLKWMAGCWQAKLDKDNMVEEDWSEPLENLLLSTTRYFTKDRATSFEFSKIEVTDSGTTFSASTEGKPFDSYMLKTLVDEYVVFENLKKSFPQRIIYRFASDGYLIPRNEGEGQPSIELRMKKVKCGGDDR